MTLWRPRHKGDFPSLGWTLLEWYANYLRVPSGPLYGQPLRLTDEQITILVRWYGLHPRSGAWLYRRGSVRRPQGWGKSPLLAATAFGELVGPVVFDGWDANGDPVGKPQPTPWVQIAAVSEDQTDNTYVALRQSLEDSPAIDELGVDLGLTRVYLKDRPGRLEPVTASAGSRLGQPVTFAVLDETHLWNPRNGGVKLAATLRRNTAKMASGGSGRTFESTNAYAPGEGSVAEDSHRSAKGAGVLYDASVGPAVKDLTERPAVMDALRSAYGDSVAWVDLERIFAEIQDPATAPEDARRFYLNEIVAGSEDFVELALWDLLGPPTTETLPLVDGETVGLGFDGSDTGDDMTALVAVRWPDWRIERLASWRKPEGHKGLWKVPRTEVHAAVAEAFARFRVARFYADPPYWRTEIDQWQSEYGDVIKDYATFSHTKMAALCDRFTTMVRAGQVSHGGDDLLTEHVGNARRSKTPSGWRPEKKAPARHIDALVAAMLAVHALGDAVGDGELVVDDYFVAMVL